MATIRAKLAVKKIIENAGKGGKPIPVSKALEAVGYSRSYAHNPQDFIKTNGAMTLLEQYLPDELLTKTHNELIGAATIQHYYFPKLSKDKKGKKAKSQELSNEEIKEMVESVSGCRLIYVKRDYWGAYAFFQAPDGKLRKDAIDMAYKRKGEYAPEKIELTKRKYQDLSNADLAALEKKLIDRLTKKK